MCVSEVSVVRGVSSRLAPVLVLLFAAAFPGCNCGVHQTPDGGSAAICEKPANKALRFSGQQYVLAMDSNSLHLTDLTVEAWVNFTSTTPSGNVIMGKPYGSGVSDSFAIWHHAASGTLFAIADTSAANALSYPWNPVAGRWYHLAFTYEGATRARQLFIDGTRVASDIALGSLQYDSHGFFIGSDADYEAPVAFFIGAIDEVRIWTSVRAIDEIGGDLRSCSPGGIEGLAAYFPFDEGEGQTAFDVSGNGNTARLGATTSAENSDPVWIDSTVPF